MSVTLIIVVITIAASFYAWSDHSIYEKWMMNPYRVHNNNEYYRFITSGFIHSGYMHLAFNMIALYGFGRIVEYVLGPIHFLIMYLGGIVISDIPTYLKYKHYAGYNSLGASGGVSSIVFSSILIYPLQSIFLFFIPVPIPGFIFGAIYLIYSYFQAKNSSDNINHDAHFYGSIFGIVYTIIVMEGALRHFLDQLSGWSMF